MIVSTFYSLYICSDINCVCITLYVYECPIEAISWRSWKLGGCWSRSHGRLLQRDYCSRVSLVYNMYIHMYVYINIYIYICMLHACVCVCMCSRAGNASTQRYRVEVIESGDELNNGATECCKWIGSWVTAWTCWK